MLGHVGDDLPTTSTSSRMFGAGVRSIRFQYIAIAILTIFIALQVMQSWKGASDPTLRYASVAGDFKDFYCAGATANIGENPYLSSSLTRCGTPAGAPLPSYVRDGLAAPSPMPGYQLAVFRLFAKLPFIVSAVLFSLLSFLSLTYAVIRLSNMSGCPPIAVFAAFAMPLYYTSVEWGNVPAILVGAIVATAYALKQRAYTSAGFMCIVTLIEPHVGLPACLSLFFWAPATRRPIAIGVAMLGILSLLTNGLSGNIEFFSKVLPLQAYAEVPAQMQYSLTWLCYAFGLSDALALKIGSISFVLMAVLGIWVARKIARVANAEEFLPIVPSAFVVLGGTYVHLFQTSVSIVLGLLLLRFGQRRSPLLFLGLALQIPVWFVEPWLAHPYTLVRFESALAVGVFLFFTLDLKKTQQRLSVAITACVIYLVLSFGVLHASRVAIRPPASVAAYTSTVGADLRYASGEWGRWLRATPFTIECDAMVIALKIPIWLALLFLCGITIARSQRRLTSINETVAPIQS